MINAPLVLSGPLTDGFVLQSSAFTDGGTLPTDYSCDGPAGGMSPPLSWSGAPSNTQVFALIDQDPDAGASGSAFTHWVIYNIPASASQLQAGLSQGAVASPLGALQGQNGRSIVGYQGACPSPGSPPHHYTFQLFALKAPLPLSIGASIGELQRAMSGNVLGQTKLVALFAH